MTRLLIQPAWTEITDFRDPAYFRASTCPRYTAPGDDEAWEALDGNIDGVVAGPDGSPDGWHIWTRSGRLLCEREA